MPMYDGHFYTWFQARLGMAIATTILTNTIKLSGFGLPIHGRTKSTQVIPITNVE